MTDMIANTMRWPHVTPAIAQKACEEYHAQFGKHDPELLESPGWWLWKRTRALAELKD